MFLMRFVVAVAIALISFFAALTVFDYFDSPKADDPNRIRIVEATFGANCIGNPVLPGHVSKARIGNATDLIAALCTPQTGTCSFALDIAKLGDPAPGCGKTFEVKWTCGRGSSRALNVISVPAPAESNDPINVSCPPQKTSTLQGFGERALAAAGARTL